jgi:hypothetical protein
MPRIRDNIRDCGACYYPSVAAAEAGVRPAGNGFLVGIRSKTDENWCYPYVVANRRVIESGATTVRLNTKVGATDIIELTANDWFFHPDGDDLAVASIHLHADYHEYMLVSDNPMFLTREWMGDARLGLGDDVFTVGRLIDQEGRQHDSPTVRFGQISTMPGEPLRTLNGRLQECFLVDLQSIGGLTGSPVFVTVHHLRLNNPVEFNHAWIPHLLGVHCGHMAAPAAPAASSGLMMVLPAWRLADILNRSEFSKPRAEEDARRQGAVIRKQRGAPSIAH